MIAAFDVSGELHAVHLIARHGLKVVAHGHCPANASAADGVLQLPDWAFDGRQTYQVDANRMLRICQACARAMKVLREPPRTP
jgi:hypothetical protein